MLWSGLLRGGSNKDHNKCLVIHCKPRMLLWGHGVCVYVGYNIFFSKKKKSLKLLQHRSILPILIGQVSELFIGANEFNI